MPNPGEGHRVDPPGVARQVGHYSAVRGSHDANDVVREAYRQPAFVRADAGAAEVRARFRQPLHGWEDVLAGPNVEHRQKTGQLLGEGLNEHGALAR